MPLFAGYNTPNYTQFAVFRFCHRDGRLAVVIWTLSVLLPSVSLFRGKKDGDNAPRGQKP